MQNNISWGPRYTILDGDSILLAAQNILNDEPKHTVLPAKKLFFERENSANCFADYATRWLLKSYRNKARNACTTTNLL